MSSLRSAIPGVEVVKLRPHADSRGDLTEMFRSTWFPRHPPFVQWNLVRSRANSLRGIHVHLRHADLLYVIEGGMTLGFVDLRKRSATYLREERLELSPAAAAGVLTPPGVAHAFHNAQDAVYLYAVTEYFSPEDELGCRWDDARVSLFDKRLAPVLSPRDVSAGSLDALLEQLESHQSGFHAAA
jgi:dTDP-4-dehydrorhamnose 3,5-epimerase